MKYAIHIAAILLGLLFALTGALFLLQLLPSQPPPPEGSPAALFMGAFYPSGYLHFVKVCEVVGGILVVIPYTRNIGLLILGPIIVNILAFHTFVMDGEGLLNPILLLIVALAAFLLWAGRKSFAALLGNPPTTSAARSLSDTESKSYT